MALAGLDWVDEVVFRVVLCLDVMNDRKDLMVLGFKLEVGTVQPARLCGMLVIVFRNWFLDLDLLVVRVGVDFRPLFRARANPQHNICKKRKNSSTTDGSGSNDDNLTSWVVPNPFLWARHGTLGGLGSGTSNTEQRIGR